MHTFVQITYIFTVRQFMRFLYAKLNGHFHRKETVDFLFNCTKLLVSDKSVIFFWVKNLNADHSQYAAPWYMIFISIWRHVGSWVCMPV